MIKTAVVGAAGRMGRMLVSQVLNDAELELVGATEYVGAPVIGDDVATLAGLPPCGVVVTDNLQAALQDADAVIDFSTPESTRETIRVAASNGVAMVIGTTGLTTEDRALIAEFAENGSRIVFAPNMSIGVNLLFHLCGKVAVALGEDYDIEVVEMHHNRKMDAPSGTAERLGEILADATGLDYAQDTRHGRKGNVGARTKREIGMHALRGGDVVGDHTIVYATDGERVELTHKASSRETFTRGALRAVKFLATTDSGLYDMQAVLGLG